MAELYLRSLHGDEENVAGTGTKKTGTQKKWATASHFQGGLLLINAARWSESPPTRTNVARIHPNLNKKRVGPWQIDWSTGVIPILYVAGY